MKSDLQKFADDSVARYENARKGFIEAAVSFGKGAFTEVDGAAILEIYRKLKVVKYDPGVGRFNVVHGAYWSMNALTNALTLSKAVK